MTNEGHDYLATDIMPEADRQRLVPVLGTGATEAAINEEMKLMDAENMREMSLQGKVEFLPGTLKDLVPNPRAEWTGKISVEKRIANNEISRSDVEHVKNRVSNFYLETTPGSIVRCIDGRTAKGFMTRARSVIDGAKDYISRKGQPSPAKAVTISKESPAFEALGPEIPGGTLAGGVSYRHATSSRFSDFEQASIAEDASIYGEKSAAPDKWGNAVFAAGDHSANPDHPGLGCGAVDGIVDIHNKVNPNNLKTLHRLMKGVLGTEFRETHFAHFISSSNSLAANEKYFESLPEAINKLESDNPHSLPELEGEHGEVILMINRVKNTTLHRDYMNAVMQEETGKDLQVFGYDLWYSEMMAQKLFPESEEARERYLHCRLAMAVAAIMYLTDGSLEVGIRTSDDQLLQAA